MPGIIPCPDCGKDVSVSANACPHCGSKAIGFQRERNNPYAQVMKCLECNSEYIWDRYYSPKVIPPCPMCGSRSAGKKEVYKSVKFTLGCFGIGILIIIIISVIASFYRYF